MISKISLYKPVNTYNHQIATKREVVSRNCTSHDCKSHIYFGSYQDMCGDVIRKAAVNVDYPDINILDLALYGSNANFTMYTRSLFNELNDKLLRVCMHSDKSSVLSYFQRLGNVIAPLPSITVGSILEGIADELLPFLVRIAKTTVTTAKDGLGVFKSISNYHYTASCSVELLNRHCLIQQYPTDVARQLVDKVPNISIDDIRFANDSKIQQLLAVPANENFEKNRDDIMDMGKVISKCKNKDEESAVVIFYLFKILCNPSDPEIRKKMMVEIFRSR